MLVVMLAGCATQATTSASEASATTSSSGSSGSSSSSGRTSGPGGSSPTSGPGSSSSDETGGGSGTDAASSSGGPGGDGLLFADAHVVGLGLADIRVVDGKVSAVGQLQAGPGETVIDLSGRWVAPAFIDSHVHLVYAPAAVEFAARGVAGAVDLAAPVAIFGADMSPLRVLATGPMITAELGYPTQSWGANGYGLEWPRSISWPHSGPRRSSCR